MLGRQGQARLHETRPHYVLACEASQRGAGRRNDLLRISLT